MKLMSTIVVLSILCTGLIYGQGATCTVDQMVKNLPIADANGAHWYNYKLADAEGDVCIETDETCWTLPFSGDLFWSAEVGYAFYPPQPLVDDWLIMFGSWDSAYVNGPGTYGDNPNHTGFYWLYSDSLTDVSVNHWPDDTVRPIPKPIVTQTGPGGIANDTIWVTIPNPRETRYTGQTSYDILGFWLFADTTLAGGTPNAYDAGTGMDIGFIEVQGVYGENTVYWMLESDRFEAFETWPTYFAYKIVARPDTVDAPADTMGYSTYYFSQNSDEIIVEHNVIGIEETETSNLKSQIALEIYPNPFKDKTEISFSRGQSAESIELKTYDAAGKLVKSFPVINLCDLNKSVVSVCWDGRDNAGKQLSNGIYFCQIKTENIHLSKQVILLR